MKKIITIILFINVFAVTAQNLTWTDISSNYNVPTGVKVFSGEDASIPLKVKYIDVDLNMTDLELTPVLGSTATNVKNWATNLGAIATMNGGYFGGAASNSSFSAVVNNTVEAKNVASVTRNSASYPVTRGFFGFNTDGTMAVNWIYHFGNNKTDIYTYATPNPNTETSPAPTPTQANGTVWANLEKGLGAGPVLIKNGTIVDTYTEEVFWGSGVSNTGLDPRSAMGYTANKHVILMVADGRQAGVSAGASIPQMASILSNLGCVEALNFDGGGSSQLATPDAFINTPSESFRSVPSVWAVFKKINLETPVPTAPADQSSTQDNPVNLSWNMPTETGVTYRIQVATSKNAWNNRVGFTPNTTTNSTVLVNETTTAGMFDFTNLTLGTTYFWSVVAYKAGGFQSYYSEPVSFIFSNGVEVDWKRASVSSDRPTWFGTDTERGLAYANNKLYVASRSGGVKVRVLNFFDGTDVGELSTTGISGGTHAISDIEADDNGFLFACNLAIGTNTIFKVYRWASDTAIPETIINYTLPTNLRLGDKFTVIGNFNTNAVILALSAGGTKVMRWVITNGMVQSPTEITLAAATGSLASITATGVADTSDLIVNSNANNVILYSSAGVNLGTLPSSIADASSNSVKYFELDGKKYLAVYNAGSSTGNNSRIVDITNGFGSATVVATTDRLGDTTNGNAAGDVAIRFTTSPVSLTALTLATNNGINAKRIFGTVVPDGASNNSLSVEQNVLNATKPISIYPNPTNSKITINILSYSGSKSAISIYSIDGKLVKSDTMINNVHNLDVSSLQNGIYMVKIQNGSQTHQSKFIKI